MRTLVIFGCFVVVCCLAEEKSWKDKDIRDMSDADMERIFDQWEENDDDPLEPDELPEHLRPSPQIDMSKIDMSNPDEMLKMTKKGKSVMMFVDVKKDLPVEEADSILKFWHQSLRNNHLIAERYPIEDRRAIYMFTEGSQAIDAKNYLIDQPELSHITLEGQTFNGKYAAKEPIKPPKASIKQGKKTEL